MPVESAQRIASAVTPAVMVSACGLIALGLDNQAARMANRLRELTREFRDPSRPTERQPMLAEQIRVLGRRHQLYATALLLNYAALLAFVVTSLLYLAQGVVALPSAAPIVAFTIGVVLLGAMALFVLSSLRLARSALLLEQNRTLRPREA
ncbi:MAG TPA: DUF2721 domain-containing protein [Myxococcales bacterium]|jgi:hypothetical protein